MKHHIAHTLINYLAIKNELLVPATTWMNLKAKDVRHYRMLETGSSSVKHEEKSII